MENGEGQIKTAREIPLLIIPINIQDSVHCQPSLLPIKSLPSPSNFVVGNFSPSTVIFISLQSMYHSSSHRVSYIPLLYASNAYCARVCLSSVDSLANNSFSLVICSPVPFASPLTAQFASTQLCDLFTSSSIISCYILVPLSMTVLPYNQI